MKPERAPAAQQNAPAGKIAPSMHAGERGSVETTGQGSSHTLKPGAGGNAELNEHGTVGAAPQKEDSEGKSGKSGMKAEEHSQTKAGAKAQQNSQSSGAFKSESNSEEHAKGAEHGASSKSATEESGHKGKSDTTGQGAAASSAKLTTEQRTKITTVIKKHKVEPAHLNISVRVGVHIPEHVHYYPLPAEVVTVYPEWRGYDYILVGDQIVIIDPDTRAVVFILEA